MMERSNPANAGKSVRDNRRTDKSHNIAEERFRKIIESAHEGLAVTDERGQVILWNESLERSTGLSAAEVLGQPLWNIPFFKSPRPQRSTHSLYNFRIEIEDFLHTGTSPWAGRTIEVDFTRPDGQKRLFEGRFTAIKADKGFMLVSTMGDITERKKAEEALRVSEAKFRSIVEQAQDGILLIDQQGRVIEWNASYARLTGVAREEAIGQPLARISKFATHLSQSYIDLHLEIVDLARTLPHRRQVIAMEREVEEAGHGLRYLYISLFPIRLEGETQVSAIIRDVTALKDTEDMLKRQAAQLDTLRRAGLEISSELGLETLLWLIGPRAIELLNGAAMALYLFNAEENILELAISLGDNQPPLEQFCARGVGLPGQLWDSGEPLLLEEYHTGLTGDLSRSAWGKVAGVPLAWGGEFVGVMFVFSGHSFGQTDLNLLSLFGSHVSAAIRNARMHQQLVKFATSDPLTGIFNRRHFFSLGEPIFTNAQRYNFPTAAIIFDLDYFKQVNDQYGHLAGDDVLCTVVDRCVDAIRETDIIARYGGEEFVILMPETDLGGARILADRLRTRVAEKPIHTDRGEVAVTISIGVAELKPDMQSLEHLVNTADDALYIAKQGGRNRVSIAGASPA
jgi:diguanylate cyclase (GGDEF)-like protein/PAS domain S-box-containing protein